MEVVPFLNVKYNTGWAKRFLPFNFFRHSGTSFLEKKFNVPKGPPFDFLIFCKRMDVKNLKSSIFRFFGYYER